MNLLNEAKRLYDAGWAVHWLVPKEKRPLGSWNSKTRAPWGELESRFQPNLNLGVKLGTASHLANGYLACLDCDVKSSDSKHQAEMEARLLELYPALNGTLTATVMSGRGLGSKHLYGVTHAPEPYRLLAQSSEEVRVQMYSVKPNRRELGALSETDIKNGIRLRPAWEIALMSEGRQMALPPSIHPDSGKRYIWGSPFQGAESLMVLDPPADVRATKMGNRLRAVDFTFDVVDVDLVMDERITQSTLDLITQADIEDHSAALFKVCKTLQNVGLTRDEVLSVLTDPAHALGECAYRHIQKPVSSEWRARAAHWVWKYTYEPALKQTRSEFDNEQDAVMPELEDADAEHQVAELLGDRTDGNWESRLERGGQNGEGRPMSTLQNILLVLQNAVAPHLFRKCLFTSFELYGVNAPWGAREGAEIRDIDLIQIKCWLADHYRFEPSTQLINEAVTKIAEENPFHPVRDYLNGLEWDGVPRADTWLRDYLGAVAPEPYLSAVSRKTLCAMVARVFEPGRKFDYVLILEGTQGIGKSTALRKLGSDEWFSDAHIDIKDKDAVLSMRGVWLVELGELSSLRKADVDQLKEFISRTTDRIRVPYGRRTEPFPRQSVFVGTTNSAEYFRDTTGNRRFWPVTVGECRFNELEKVRDQLFAEARWYYDLGELLYLENEDANSGATAEQEKRMVHDTWADSIAQFLEQTTHQKPGERKFNPECFSTGDIFSVTSPLATAKPTPFDQQRVSSCLRRLGFRSLIRKENKKSVRRWVPVTLDATLK